MFRVTHSTQMEHLEAEFNEKAIKCEGGSFLIMLFLDTAVFLMNILHHIAAKKAKIIPTINGLHLNAYGNL